MATARLYDGRMRRRATLLIALAVTGVVAIAVGAVWSFADGSTVSSPSRPAVTKVWTPPRPKAPPAQQLRGLLRANGDHPTTCSARGSEMVCLLAHKAGRCEQDADGNGECTYRGTNTSHRFLTWATSTVSATVVVTGSDSR